MLKKRLLPFLLLFPLLASGQKATITLETRNILTYPYNDPNPVPIIGEGRGNVYPYHSFQGYSIKGTMQEWKVVKLENDYVQVWVMPSDGGKVWGAIEKSTGQEFIYRNEVMKYRNIALRGPWSSGGIEFNFGTIAHSPSTCAPVDYKMVENKDGSVSCIVGTYDFQSRTKWYVEIRLPKDKAYFETRALWTNTTLLPQTFYSWMTASAAVSDDLRFHYPGTAELGHEGEHGLWPVKEDGNDVSWYKNNNLGSHRSNHVVGEYNDFMGGYFHKTNFGYGHWALYDEVPGKKLWLWSLSREGGIWEDLLTDTDGQYMEHQAGRGLNQHTGISAFQSPLSLTPFMPGVTERYRSIWFPVKDIGGMSDVSPNGALHADVQNGSLKLGINSFAFIEGKIIVKTGGKVVFTETRQFKPMDVFQASVPVNGNDYEIIVEGMDLQYSPTTRQLIQRPFISTMPKDLVTPTTLYQEGMQNKETRNYTAAMKFLKKCLEKDPLHIDAMAAMSELYYRLVRYDSALYHANNALMLDTYHPAANYNAAITYLALGNTTDALECFGWAARSPEYRSAAYAQMANIKLRLGDQQLTEHYANQSLDFGRYNFNALQTLAIMYRKSGEKEKAEAILRTILSVDQLNHFADFERYLLNPTAEHLTNFRSTITNEYPYHTFLELASIYYDLRMIDDAYTVLDQSPSHPLVTIWKAYLKKDKSMLDQAVEASPEFVFPYRTDDVAVLKWALSEKNHWKFRYYLALNYYSIYRYDEGNRLLNECGNDPDYATFYLARVELVKSLSDAKKIADLEMAQKLSPNDWRAALKIIQYYSDQKDFKKMLDLSSTAYKKYKDNSAIEIQYVHALINNGQYENSLKLLDRMIILPSEHAGGGKVMYEQASLFIAIDLIGKKKYSNALKMIEKSKEWPERLGVGKPLEVDTRVQDYLNIYCLNRMNKKDGIDAMKNSIAGFSKNEMSSLSNILTINELRNMGKTAEADALIRSLGESKNNINQWVVAKANNDLAALSKLEKNLETNINFQIIKKTLAL